MLKPSFKCISIIKDFEGFRSKPYNDAAGHCFPPGTLVRSKSGYVPIETIIAGDFVLTESGQFNKVKTVMSRSFTGNLISVNTYGSSRPTLVTPEHPFKTIEKKRIGRAKNRKNILIENWTKAEDIHSEHFIKSGVLKFPIDQTELVIPDEFKYVNVKNLSRGVDRPASKLNYSEIDLIRFLYFEVKLKQTDLAKMFNISQTTISNIILNKIWNRESINIKKERPGPNIFQLTDDLLWILGLYLAEGCSSNSAVQFSLHEKETAFMDKIEMFFNSFGIYTRRQKDIPNYHGKSVFVYNSKLADLFPILFGKNCYNKYIPEKLFNLPNNKIALILRGILDGDGYTMASGTEAIGQTSEILALQMAEISRRIGAQPTLTTKIKKQKNLHTIYNLTGATPDNFRKSINKRCVIKNNSDFYYRVKDIGTQFYDGIVYNLEVEIDPTYIVNGLVVHNCTIGYGTLLHYGPVTKEDLDKYSDGITVYEASGLLEKAVSKMFAEIEPLILVDLTQNQVDAVMSFVYNLGTTNFKKSTLLKKINAKDFVGAANEFTKWVKAGGKTLPGLVKRRETERKIFLS